MEKVQRENFQRTIDEQARKIETYKKKLKDVVEAYKDLSKEKLALEASINALSSGKDPSSDKHQTDASHLSHNEDDEQGLTEEEALAAATRAEETGGTSEHPQQDNLQTLGVLTTSLKVLTQQKNKLESSWVAERKQYKLSLEEKEKEVEGVLKQLQQAEDDIAQWRGKLRCQQQEHSRQQEDCTLMIKELQALLTNQKMHNQQLLAQVEEMRVMAEEKDKRTALQTSALEQQERQLRGHLEALKGQLQEAQNKASSNCPQLQALKKQVVELQEHEGRLRREERMKAVEWEAREREVGKQHEERLNEVEARVVQLSQVLAQVEKNKAQLIDTIQKLSHKNAQLDLEVSTLTTLARSPDLDCLLAELASDELYARARFIMARLKESNYDRGLLNELLGDDEDAHRECRRQLQEGMEEFERYKLRAQSVLKNKCKENSAEQEGLKLQTQISELRDRLERMQAKVACKEEELRGKEESFSMMLSSLKSKHCAEVDKVVVEARQQVLGMEGEMKRQRDRTVSLLAEKDQEVSDLRRRLASLEGSKVTAFSSDNEVGASSVLEDDASLTLEQLLSSRAKEQLRSSDRMLHYAQEKAMMEAQVSALRKDKFRLESEVKEVRLEWAGKEGMLEEEVAALKEEVRKGDRAARRESANLEYLKNIVYQFMLATSTSSKQQIAKAIATILQFSPYEVGTLQAKKGWSLGTKPHEHT